MVHLDPMYLILAYSGLLINILLKLAELPGKLFEGFTKKDWIVTLASSISIPVILVICTDTSLNELLPINFITAFLSGYQTQALLATITSLGNKMTNSGNNPKV